MSQTTTDTNLYFYSPSIAAAIVASILYAVLAGFHFYLCIIYARRQPVKHRHTIPLFVAALISTVGWSTRIASASNTSNIPLYAVSSSYIVISPIFVCATLYLLLSRLIRLGLPEGGRQQVFFHIPPRWLGRIFIMSDIFSFLTQCSGSGIASSGNWEGNTKDIGIRVLLVGLALQLATFTVFLTLMWRYVCRVRASVATGFHPSVKKVILGVWVAGAFVEIRSIYRVIEFGLGIDGYPFRHEWCTYVLEGVPMWIALAVLAVYHPVKWLQSKPAHDGIALTDHRRRGDRKDPGVPHIVATRDLRMERRSIQA